MNTRSIDQIIGDILAWLQPRADEVALQALRTWGARDWDLARRVIFMHGVGPSLHHSISAAPCLSTTLPVELRSYLADQLRLNTLRIERLHARLSDILQKASQVGIEVIPLKGSLLTTQGGADVHLRPMADIDLLIHPSDQHAMYRLMVENGYQKDRPKALYPHHDQYKAPNDKVVSWTGEHPDNPIPVEIHTSLRRILWADQFIPDFGPGMWKSARPGKVLGQPVMIPESNIHFAYLAIHALIHLLDNQGRLVHWLDLAQLAPSTSDLGSLPYPNLLAPMIRLASRAFPGKFTGVDLSLLAGRVEPRLLRWAERVPLSGRCGLNARFRRFHWLEDRWETWHPTGFRLMIAYPSAALPRATMLYLRDSTVHLAKRFHSLLTRQER